MGANQEVEVKIVVVSPSDVYAWLNEHAENEGTQEQSDVYYDPPGRSFISTNKGFQTADEWLRLRTANNTEICYKKWHRDHDGKSTYADEIETEVERVDQMREILARLGFTQTAKVVKKRTSYRYEDFIIACDDVENLGFFIEIEYVGALDPDEGKKQIYSLIKTMNITKFKEIEAGYPLLFWNPSLMPRD